MFCGGGGGSGGSGSSSTTDDEGNSYNFVYSGFVDGYNGYDASQGVNWSLYLGGSGGGSSDPCTPQAVKGKTIQQLPGGCSPDGTTYVITPAMVINAAAVKYQLTSDQQYWLNNNKGTFDMVDAFIKNDNNLYLSYYDAMDYWNFAIWELSQNGMSLSDFQAQYMTPNISMSDIDTYSGDESADEPDNDIDSYSGPTEHIPSQITLANGQVVQVIFGVTESDHLSADNPVSVKLVNLLIQALNIASQHMVIKTIYISATTNGLHSNKPGYPSNHYIALAIDLSRINGVPIVTQGASEMVTQLQLALDQSPDIRENFGPAFKHKWGQPYRTTDGVDHIHFSTNP